VPLQNINWIYNSRRETDATDRDLINVWDHQCQGILAGVDRQKADEGVDEDVI
jgi:hypothetical protein